MPVLRIKKDKQIRVACVSCIKGHRSKSCKHFDRILVELRRPGRPQHNCQHPDPSVCGCTARPAYYVPGHQPQFAASTGTDSPVEDDGPVIINAVEHELPQSPEPTNNVSKRKASSRSDDVESPTSESRSDDLQSSTPRARKVTPRTHEHHNTHDHHLSSPNAGGPAPRGISSDLTTLPAGTKSIKISGHCDCCTKSRALHVPGLMDIDPQNLMLGALVKTPEDVHYTSPGTAINSNHDAPLLLQSPAYIGTQDERGQPRTNPSRPGLSEYAEQMSTEMPDALRNGIIARVAERASMYDALRMQTSYPFTHQLQPQVFFNEDVHRAQAQCMCAGDENCLCPGCIDHPRNAATMEEVMDAFNFQQSDTYQELGDLGFDLNDPFLLPDGLEGIPMSPGGGFDLGMGATGQASGLVEGVGADTSITVDPKETLLNSNTPVAERVSVPEVPGVD